MSLRWWLSVVLGLGAMAAAIAAQPGGKRAKDPPRAAAKSDVDDEDAPAKKTGDADPADEGDDTDEAAETEKPKAGSELSDAAEKELAKKISYLTGHEFVTNLMKQGVDIDAAEFLRGAEEAFAGKKMEMSQEEIKQATTDFQALMIRKLPARNKKDGEAFLAENKKKKGVKTLPSGLQYLVLKSGKGASPKATDTVTVHYKGTFINGNEFDSSYRRGQPASFPVNGVIQGWTEALQLMKVGDKWQVVIPPELAYKEAGVKGAIPPNATLIFEVELLKIDGARGKAPPAEEN